MVIPNTLSKATEPGGTGQTVRCIVEKHGRRFTVSAIRQRYDEETDAVTFPSELYSGEGFTLLAIEGEPDFEAVLNSLP